MKKLFLCGLLAALALFGLSACTKDDLSQIDIKTDGSFKNLFGDKVDSVYLSANGKYMMVYSDKTINDDTKETDENYTKRQEVIDKFMDFKK